MVNQTGALFGSVKQRRRLVTALNVLLAVKEREAENLHDIALALGVTWLTVRQALFTVGIEPRRVELYLGGLLAPEEKAGLEWEIDQLISDLQRSIDQWPLRREKVREICRLYEETDLTYDEIGARVGLTKQRVGQILEEALASAVVAKRDEKKRRWSHKFMACAICRKLLQIQEQTGGVVSWPELRREVSCPPSTRRMHVNYLISQGLLPKSFGRFKYENHARFLREYLRNPNKLIELARKYQVKYPYAVIRLLFDKGLTQNRWVAENKKNKSKRMSPLQKKIIELKRQGLTNAEIARRLGCMRMTVMRAVKVAALAQATIDQREGSDENERGHCVDSGVDSITCANED